ncbi:MAG: hypothetical protein ACRDFX_04605 [Chloroflexota bacterium]
MIQAPTNPRLALEERLTRGADLLLEMEQRGELGVEYHRWLAHWLVLLGEYEELAAA